MLTVGMLFLLILMPSAWGFTHIKLSDQFEATLGQDQKNQPRLLKSAKGLNLGMNTIPVDGQVSPIYQEVENYLEQEYQSIANRQILDLTIINGELHFGLNNFLGFSWQRPFGAFSVNADRQVTQNLFADNWIVQDTFTFKVEASKLLEDMKDQGQVVMSDTEIGAFAGLSFQRTYTYYHYAPTYEEGLRSDYRKLFFPYKYFQAQQLGQLGNEEIVKKNDSWKARAGGLIQTPPLYNISFSAGVLATLAFEKLITLQKVSEEEKTNYQINYKSEKKIDLGATLSFQLDFFQLLNLTLLRYDLNYEYDKASAFTLAFNESNRQSFTPAQNQELSSIVRGQDNVSALTSFVHKLDESQSSSLSQSGSILLWGGIKKSKTEQVKVIKDEVIHDFFKYYSQSVTLVQNFWSRIFSAVIYKVFKIPLGSSYESLLTKQVNLEFRANHPQSFDQEVQRIATISDFSFVIKKNYQAAKTHRWWDKSKKNQVIYFLDHFTSLPKDYKTFVRNDELKGPLTIDAQFRVEEAGLLYFLSQAESNIFFSIAKVCNSNQLYKWIDDNYRKLLLQKALSGNEACVKRIGQKYLSFKKDYEEFHFSPSIKLFKSFIQDYYKKSTRLDELVVLFGSENSFIHGSFSATTGSGSPFLTTFSAGQFRGLGVIDNFQRSTGSRQPASIISE